MITKAAIDRFVQGRTLAMVGISANGKGFGNAAYKELKLRGYKVLPIHRSAGTIQGDACFASLSALPEPVERLLVVVDPDDSEKVVRDAAAAGINQVWLQQGAECPAAIRAAEEQGLSVVHGQCILMFANPRSFHKFHGWLWGLFGKIPKQ